MLLVSWFTPTLAGLLLAAQAAVALPDPGGLPRDVGARLPRRAPRVSDGAGLKPSGLKKVFKGPEGEAATLVFLAPSDRNLILIRFDGTGSAWDGRVFLHRIQAVGLGEDYVADVGGKDYVTITMRDVYGKSYQLHPPNQPGPLRLTFAEAESKAADPEAVFKQYQKQVGP
jgi:hypothetical protein